MAPPTNLKIEDLKARLRVDPKSRHFYPLAEELRRAGRFEEAEQILREGLIAHPTYLSAWIVLGRVLKETGRLEPARDALAKALMLDPGNVVAARLAAEVFMTLGEKVEAIKKYKLVAALMPGDEEIETIVERLEFELGQGGESGVIPPAHADAAGSEQFSDVPRNALPEETPVSPVTEEIRLASAPLLDPFSDSDVAQEAEAEEPEQERPGIDASPFSLLNEPSHLEASPEVREETEEVLLPVMSEGPASADESSSDEHDHDEELVPDAPAAEVIATVTMGDLYLSQGHVEAAEDIYRKVLERDPANDAAREKLELLRDNPDVDDDPRRRKIEALRGWLQKVAR